MASFSVESTRYVKYDELIVIQPTCGVALNYVEDVYKALSSKEVKYLYTTDLIFGTNDAGWTSRFLKDGKLFKEVSHPEPEWSFFTPDMLHDICYFYSEAIAIEHEKNRQLAQEFEELQREVGLLSGRMERLEGAKGSARSLFGRAKRFLARKFR